MLLSLAWGGTELALLCVDRHSQVVVHLYRRMVPFRGVYVQPHVAEQREGRLLQLHGRVEGLHEEGEVVDKWEQPGSRQSPSTANPSFLRLARLSGRRCRLGVS